LTSTAPPTAEETPAARVIARILFWAAAAFAFVMAVIPSPPELPGHPSDKIQHILAFLVLAALGWLAYPKVKKRELLLGLAAFGALIEMVQAIPMLHRDSDPYDWVADTAAAFTVFLVIALWTWFRSRPNGR
jgi:VanZ family protein